ncbi:MAG: hypothetical protein HHAS10_02320 [Candidatus Altimarinota bacterium]
MSRILVHGITIDIHTSNDSLLKSIEEYYQIFLVESTDTAPDIVVNLDLIGYFEKIPKKILPSEGSIRVGDTIWIHKEKKEYTFQDREIMAQITWDTSGSMCIEAYLKPLAIRHWVNIALQGTTRISKYYNRFFIKTCIHDPLFVLLEKKFGIILLHATAVTNGKKTFVFSGLGGSGKSTTAAAFSTQHGYTILADNYVLLKGKTLYPFPELARVTKETENLLGIRLKKKADGIKSYLQNDTKSVQESYEVRAIFLCSYGDSFRVDLVNDVNTSFENMLAINHYTKEFPEYGNLALLSLLSEYNTGSVRMEELKNICQENHVYFLQNDKNIISHIPEIASFQ